MDTAYLIEQLLQYGEAHGFLKGLDSIVARNTLLDLFGLAQPYAGEVGGAGGSGFVAGVGAAGLAVG